MSAWNDASFLPLLLDHVATGIVVLDGESRIVKWNDFMVVNSGHKAEAVVNRVLFDVFPQLPRRWLEKKLESVRLLRNFSFTAWEQRPWLFNFAHHRPITGGIDRMRQNCVFMPIAPDPNGAVEFIAIMISDVTDVAIAQTRLESALVDLERLSTTDALTGVCNRRHLQDRLEAEIARAGRHAKPLSLAMFDLDFFKKINDTWGHAGGDEVLREVARRVKSILRTPDILGRFGGEEFVLILPDTDAAGAAVVAERARACIAATATAFGDKTIPVSASFGVAQSHAGLNTPEALLQEADLGLYEAKRAGRNRVVVCRMPESGTGAPPLAVLTPTLSGRA